MLIDNVMPKAGSFFLSISQMLNMLGPKQVELDSV
jgi:hypothetical protein